MRIFVLNGPNLDLLGLREPDLYGHATYADLEALLSRTAKECGVDLVVRQSNHEGDLVDWIGDAYRAGALGIVINPAAYTHTSVALRDALLAVKIPTVEVHLTDPDARESFRRVNFIRDVVQKTIVGRGIEGYRDAILYLANHETAH